MEKGQSDITKYLLRSLGKEKISEIEMYVVKIDGKWYCMTEYYDFMVPGA